MKLSLFVLSCGAGEAGEANESGEETLSERWLQALVTNIQGAVVDA